LSEIAFLPSQIDSYGLWNVSQEMASIKDIDKEFQGTLCLGRLIREIYILFAKDFPQIY
jgi:hypothetical protein